MKIFLVHYGNGKISINRYFIYNNHSHQDDYYEFLIEIPDSVDVPTELPAGHYYLF